MVELVADMFSGFRSASAKIATDSIGPTAPGTNARNRNDAALWKLVLRFLRSLLFKILFARWGMHRAMQVIGCDIGGTQIKLLRLRNRRVVARDALRTPKDAKPAAFLKTLVTELRRFRDADAAPLSALGVALPGFLDDRRRRVVRLANLSVLNGVPLEARLQRALDVPILLEADTNAGAFAEAQRGAQRRSKRLLYVSLGTGVGAALISRGEIVRVSNNTIGHIASLRLRDGDRERSVEALLGDRGIARSARAVGLAVADGAALNRLAREGRRAERRLARAEWRRVGTLVGDVCTTLATMFSPSSVVVGGGTARSAPHFLEAATRRLRARWPQALGDCPTLTAARHGEFAGALGAALLAAPTQR